MLEQQPLNILAIVGSLRKDSFNRQLAEAARDALGDRAKLHFLSYADVPLFNQDIEYPAPEAVSRARAAVSLQHIAVNGDRALAQSFTIDCLAQRAAD